MIDRILGVASGRKAAGALALFAIGGTALFRLSPYETLKALVGGANLPEETITTPDRLAEVLRTLDAAGRADYLRFQVWDALNPVLIGFAGAMLLGWMVVASRRPGSAWRLVVVLPVVVAAADLLENVVISVAILAFPDEVATSSALPVVTALKFGSVLCMVLAVVALGLAWMRDRVFGGGPREGD